MSMARIVSHIYAELRSSFDVPTTSCFWQVWTMHVLPCQCMGLMVLVVITYFSLISIGLLSLSLLT